MLYRLLLEDFNLDVQAKADAQYLHTGLDEEEFGSLGMEAWVPCEPSLQRLPTN